MCIHSIVSLVTADSVVSLVTADSIVSLVTAAVAVTLPHRKPPPAGSSGYVPSAAQLALFHSRLTKCSEFLTRAVFLCDDVTL
jgi:hypothetical protein